MATYDLKQLEKLSDKKLKGFSTKEDLEKLSTKDDLKNFATKEDLKQFATKDDVETIVKEGLKSYATKDDLKVLAAKTDIIKLKSELEEEMGNLTREIIEGVALSRVGKKNFKLLENRVEKIEKVLQTS